MTALPVCIHQRAVADADHDPQGLLDGEIERFVPCAFASVSPGSAAGEGEIGLGTNTTYIEG